MWYSMLKILPSIIGTFALLMCVWFEYTNGVIVWTGYLIVVTINLQIELVKEQLKQYLFKLLYKGDPNGS